MPVGDERVEDVHLAREDVPQEGVRQEEEPLESEECLRCGAG